MDANVWSLFSVAIRFLIRIIPPGPWKSCFSQRENNSVVDWLKVSKADPLFSKSYPREMDGWKGSCNSKRLGECWAFERDQDQIREERSPSVALTVTTTTTTVVVPPLSVCICRPFLSALFHQHAPVSGWNGSLHKAPHYNQYTQQLGASQSSSWGGFYLYDTHTHTWPAANQETAN